MTSASPLIRGANGSHAMCHHAPCTADVEERIQAAEMEKHAHGCLTDEATIAARDGASITPGHASGATSTINDREAELRAERSTQSHWSLAQDGLLPAYSHEEAMWADAQRSKMVEHSEVDKHAQGLLVDELAIHEEDMAHMREGQRATMVRDTENEKLAHGNLQDERVIMDAHIPASLSRRTNRS